MCNVYHMDYYIHAGRGSEREDGGCTVAHMSRGCIRRCLSVLWLISVESVSNEEGALPAHWVLWLSGRMS